MSRWILALLLVPTFAFAQWDLQLHSLHGVTVVKDIPYEAMVQLDTGVGVEVARHIQHIGSVGVSIDLRRTLASRVVSGFRYSGTESLTLAAHGSLTVGTWRMRVTAGGSFALYRGTNTLQFFPTASIAPVLRLPGHLVYFELGPFIRWDFRRDVSLSGTVGLELGVGAETGYIHQQ